MVNIMTFDVEEWYHANYKNCVQEQCSKNSNLECNIDRILELCRKNNCKATFFILSDIAKAKRSMIKDIISEGHEIASHGCSHELAYSQSYEDFIEDVKTSVSILEDITGRKVLGYRAPSWSIVEKNLNYIEGLAELGLKYDASIFPTKTFLYGIPHAKREIHKPVINGKQLNIYEVPASVFNFFGMGVGFSGGFYFRLFPYKMLNSLIKKRCKNNIPTVIYLHPREIDANENKLALPPWQSFIHYCNVSKTFDKLEKVMKDFKFTSIEGYLVDNKMLVV